MPDERREIDEPMIIVIAEHGFCWCGRVLIPTSATTLVTCPLHGYGR